MPTDLSAGYDSLHKIVGGTNLFTYGGRVTSLEQTPSADAAGVADPELVDMLAQLSFLVQNALAEIAGEHDLSLTATRLLGVLRDREPTMHALGRHLGLDKSSISGLVDRAERRGLVRRSPSMTDRRALQVSITQSGLQLADIIATRFAERVEVLVGDLRDSDRRRLTHLATRIVSADTTRRGSDFATGRAAMARPA
jgi:DNA-binding MarR family transcriptional regulator